MNVLRLYFAIGILVISEPGESVFGLHSETTVAGQTRTDISTIEIDMYDNQTDPGDNATQSKVTPKSTYVQKGSKYYLNTDPAEIRKRICRILKCPPENQTPRCKTAKCSQAQIEERKRSWEEQKAEYIRGLFTRMDKTQFSIIAIVYALIFIVGITGNILIIIATLKGKGLTTTTNIFITSMAFADIIVLLLCLPIMAMEFLAKNYWFLGPAMCKIFLYVRQLSFVVSVLHLIIMGLDRYLAICHSMKARSISTVDRAKAIVILLWLLGGAMAIPTAVVVKIQEWSPRNTKCILSLERLSWEIWTYRVYYLVFVFCIPVCILIFAYGNVVKALLRSIKANALMKGDTGVKDGNTNEKSKMANEAKSRLQVVRMLVTVLVVFSICWCPALLWTVIKDVIVINEFHKNYVYVAFWTLAYANSAMNPTIYITMSRQFRKSVISLLCCGKDKKSFPKKKKVPTATLR